MDKVFFRNSSVIVLQTWNLQPTANGQAFSLTFHNFDIQNPLSSGYCDDYVMIEDGVNRTRYCGTSNPGTFTFSSTMTVKFQSDYSLKRNGFLAVACCSGSVTIISNEGKYNF